MKLTDGQITRLVAEKVMGWHWNQDQTLADQWVDADGRIAAGPWWSPLSDWYSTGQIVNRMRVIRPKLYFRLGWYLNPSASFFDNNGHPDDAYCKVVSIETPNAIPRAIAIAALLAVGAVTEEQV